MNTIGHVTTGSLQEGLTIRLNPHVGHTLAAGMYVSIPTTHGTLVGSITNLAIKPFDHTTGYSIPKATSSWGRDILAQMTFYTTAHVRLSTVITPNGKTAKSNGLPDAWSSVCLSSKHELAQLFGKDAYPAESGFHIGTLEQGNVPVYLDLTAFAQRSSAIFGKTGTGKTFLTRLALTGLLHKKRAATLIFDMHSEYAKQARAEHQTEPVKGLKDLFKEKVKICGVYQQQKREGSTPDIAIRISYDQIDVEDILSLQQELNLHPTAYEAAYLLAQRYKKEWLSVLLAKDTSAKTLAEEIGGHPESIAALQRKLRVLQRFDFIDPQPLSYDPVTLMMKHLEQGQSLIVEFGTYSSSFCYLLVANILTRRIHQQYIRQTEEHLANPRLHPAPTQLVIVIEEAHKFLNPITAKQTIFGTIAREMRKYYVSLLIVDQRPSGIDAEILSQIGTKMIAQLNDDKDISAALSGLPNTNDLKNILANLESKQHVLICGYAVHAPLAIKARTYGTEVYAEVAQNEETIRFSADAFY